jgi:hypothetical protein
VLRERQQQLLTFLSDGKQLEEKGVFADNFLRDYSVEELRKAFARAGKVLSIGGVFPENQLRGYFIVEGEEANLRVNFSLTPVNPSLIQECQIQEMKNSSV